MCNGSISPHFAPPNGRLGPAHSPHSEPPSHRESCLSRGLQCRTLDYPPAGACETCTSRTTVLVALQLPQIGPAVKLELRGVYDTEYGFALFFEALLKIKSIVSVGGGLSDSGSTALLRASVPPHLPGPHFKFSICESPGSFPSLESSCHCLRSIFSTSLKEQCQLCLVP